MPDDTSPRAGKLAELAATLDSVDDEEDRRFNIRLAFFEYLEPAARLRSLKQRRVALNSTRKSTAPLG